MITKRLVAVLLLAPAAVSCGGAEPPPDQPPADPPSQTVEREPLTEVDMVGLDSADLSFQLPWTTNRVVRDPSPLAANALVGSVEAASHPAFDRVVFTVSGITPYPGYEVDVMEGGEEVACGEGDDATPVTLPEGRSLVVRLVPAQMDEGGPSVGTSEVGGERFGAAGFVCDVPGSVVWTATLAADVTVRVLELHDPPRLVVDVR